MPTVTRHEKVETTATCGVCGEQYDLGEPTVIGGFHYWPHGERAYWKHSRGKHLPPLPSNDPPCVWTCSVCGNTREYTPLFGKHGGPTERLLDPRYGLAICPDSRYPAHKRAYGTIGSSRGPVIFYHEGAPNPVQPEQTDEIVKALEKKYEKGVSKVSGKASDGSAADRRNVRPVPVTRASRSVQR